MPATAARVSLASAATVTVSATWTASAWAFGPPNGHDYRSVDIGAIQVSK